MLKGALELVPGGVRGKKEVIERQEYCFFYRKGVLNIPNGKLTVICKCFGFKKFLMINYCVKTFVNIPQRI